MICISNETLPLGLAFIHAAAGVNQNIIIIIISQTQTNLNGFDQTNLNDYSSGF